MPLKNTGLYVFVEYMVSNVLIWSSNNDHPPIMITFISKVKKTRGQFYNCKSIYYFPSIKYACHDYFQMDLSCFQLIKKKFP